MTTQRVVLITGASSGIGKVCAEHLRQRGFRVYGTSRRAAWPSAPEASSLPMLPLDVRDDASVAQAVRFILEHEGRLDALVNNAGVSIGGAVEDVPLSLAHEVLETNFFGTLRVCRAVLPQMRAQGYGHIVNISSVAGLMGVPFHGLYSAGKFAVEGLTESLRMEVKPLGIQVSLIEPGDFHTAITAHKRMVLPDGSAYATAARRVVEEMARSVAQAPPPVPVAQQLERILNSPAPRLRYVVGSPLERLAVQLKRWLPSALFERLLMNNYGL